MIKINLARKRRGSAGASGFDLSSLKNFNLASLTGLLKSGGSDSDGEEVKLLSTKSPVLRIVLAAAFLWVVDDSITSYKKEHLKKIDDKIAVLDKEKLEIKAKLSKIDGFRSTKDKLEADEKMIRTKLEVVGRLMENRNESAKMLLHVAKSIPEEVWLSDLKADSKQVRLIGGTANSNQISDFSTALNSSLYFSKVEIKEIQETTSTAIDQRFQKFELGALRRVN